MNNRIRIKVCGMRDADNILQVAELRPDYMGFIFYSKSKRFVGEDFKMPEFPRNIKRVGVFVNEMTSTILQLAETHRLDVVQLHGDESPEQCRELKAKGFGVIKVFQIGSDVDFTDLGLYKKECDYFLFDTKSDSYGGSGKTFDWNLLKKYDQDVPFFLSGGLSIENSQNIKTLQGMNLHALDINSGVEISPGLKDVNKTKYLKDILNSQFSILNS